MDEEPGEAQIVAREEHDRAGIESSAEYEESVRMPHGRRLSWFCSKEAVAVRVVHGKHLIARARGAVELNLHEV